ncbi:hypothetical protein VF21_07934 [Pseudogymnoascus sp. 05NY08]|nr:hypothetical protein VF21_07934 [Pseudogymnoascus sp. 05NY08]
MEFADEFLGALVIGTDLSLIQPGFVPLNLKFYVDDFESPWVFLEAFNNLKPGAWMEVQEYDAWIYADDDLDLDKAPWTLGWVTQLLKSSVDFGKPLNVGRFHKGWMEEAGFTDVEEKVVKVVLSPLMAIFLIGIFVHDYRYRSAHGLRVVNSKNLVAMNAST